MTWPLTSLSFLLFLIITHLVLQSDGQPEDGHVDDLDEDIQQVTNDFMLGLHRTLESRRIRHKRSLVDSYHTISSGGGLFWNLNLSRQRFNLIFSSLNRSGQHQVEHQSQRHLARADQSSPECHASD